MCLSSDVLIFPCAASGVLVQGSSVKILFRGGYFPGAAMGLLSCQGPWGVQHWRAGTGGLQMSGFNR